MKTIFRLVVLAFVLAAGTAAQANTYIYSYNFLDNGPTVTGQFDGTPTGDLVTNISNVSLFVDGLRKEVPLSADGAASFDGHKTSFVFSSATTIDDDGAEHYLIFAVQARSSSSPDYDFAALYDLLGVEPLWNSEISTGEGNGGVPSRWSLQDVTAVPEPETYALLLAGLSIVGFAARRSGKV